MLANTGDNVVRTTGGAKNCGQTMIIARYGIVCAPPPTNRPKYLFRDNQVAEELRGQVQQRVGFNDDRNEYGWKKKSMHLLPSSGSARKYSHGTYAAFFFCISGLALAFLDRTVTSFSTSEHPPDRQSLP